MTTDARISTALPGHPKTKRLIKRLGPGAGWFLVRLFLWAAENKSDGDLTGMTNEDIEIALDWSGENDALVNELVAVRFFDGTSGAYKIHDWAEHNPWVNGSDMRSAKARWNAVKRHHGVREADRQVPEWAVIRKTEADAASKENDAGSIKRGADSTPRVAASNEIDASSNTSRDIFSDASSTEFDASSNAPSPSPSPSLKKEREKTAAIAIDSWLSSLEGVDAIPDTDPIFDYAEKTSIPQDFLALSWLRFCEDMRSKRKRQKDWRQTYRNYVIGNWYKLWWFAPDGSCQLTTAGEQARRAAA